MFNYSLILIKNIYPLFLKNVKNWLLIWWGWLFLSLFILAEVKPEKKKPVFEEVIKSIVSKF